MYFPSTPISYAVEITFECNNYCSGCANVLKHNHHERLDNWRELFDRIAPPNNRQRYAELIRITGGEPTLHPDFDKIIAYVDSFTIPFATFSNARWPDPEKIIDIFQQCQNSVGMLISLHGSNALTHQTFIGDIPKAFDETCENIQRATRAGIEVFTNTVLTKHSCEQIEELIELSQNLGAGYAVFNRFLGPPHPLEPTENQLRRAIRTIEQLYNEGVQCRIGDCVPPCFEPNSSIGSNGGIEHCAISPTGLVRPENLTHYAFGNLFEQSIEQIWQSDRAKWYRAQLPKDCIECSELSRCRGGCRSISIEYNLQCDRLMKKPIHEPDIEIIEFDPSWKPIPYFHIRNEEFGYLLCRYNWSMLVDSQAKPLIDCIDGSVTLLQICNLFGESSLDFVGYLYREGFVGFEFKST